MKPPAVETTIMTTFPDLPSESSQGVDAIISGFERLGYVADRSLATAVYLVTKLRKPILVEGHAGLGKTELAKALASLLDRRLIRLQCYEGLDVNSAVYEWNYQKQLLAIKIEEGSDKTVEEKERHIFSGEFLLERPLLQSIQAEDASPVLLIDEIDRADEAFEAFLLELLSDYQITIPEMGTVHAKHVPYVVLTSNRSRELGEALKRRCLYQWIDYPSLEKEMKIVCTRLPGIEEKLARQVVGYVQAVRGLGLSKPPGVAETLDCAEALLTLGKPQLDEEAIEQTLGCISKSVEDSVKIRSAGAGKLFIPPGEGVSQPRQ
ncbi:MAG TPA: MoxR family ATPase [Candidatus Sulfotelmatobacter sp.]|jgi:MoxR-like ATPase|nr:MoxR family ATPase [Candidatus Sulfotelmatobacter sp.]